MIGMGMDGMGFRGMEMGWGWDLEGWRWDLEGWRWGWRWDGGWDFLTHIENSSTYRKF